MGLLDVCIANYSRGSQLQEHQVAQRSKLPWSGLRYGFSSSQASKWCPILCVLINET